MPARGRATTRWQPLDATVGNRSAHYQLTDPIERQNTVMKLNRCTSALAAAGVLLGLGAGLASVAGPAWAAAPPGGHVGAPMSSIGIDLYNNSADTLLLQSVSGDNEGVPSAGSTLASGVGYQDFEVTFRAAKTTRHRELRRPSNTRASPSEPRRSSSRSTPWPPGRSSSFTASSGGAAAEDGIRQQR